MSKPIDDPHGLWELNSLLQAVQQQAGTPQQETQRQGSQQADTQHAENTRAGSAKSLRTQEHSAMVDRLSSPSTSGHAQSEQQSIASEAYWADVSDSGASSSDSRISNFSRTGPDYAPQPGTTQQIAVTSQPEPTPASNSTNVSTWKQIRISIPADPNRKTVLTYPIILDPPSRPTYSHNDPLPPKTGRSESSDWSSGRCDAAEAEMANRSAQGKIPGTAVKSGTTTTQAHDASKSPDGGSRPS